MKTRSLKWYEKFGQYVSEKHTDAIFENQDWDSPSMQLRLFAHKSAYRGIHHLQGTTLMFPVYGIRYPLFHLYGKLVYKITKKIPIARDVDETKDLPFNLGPTVRYYFGTEKLFKEVIQ